LKKIIIFCLSFFALNTVAYCGQPSRIELTDGSVINGEIVSYVNSVYTVNTAAFGEIKVGAIKVAKIESVNYVPAAAPISPIAGINNPTSSEVSDYGNALMKNPENAAIITGLASDPGLQEAARDPQVQNAVKTGDIQALMKNAKFMDIVNNPRIQESLKKLKQ
jgi:hypothetical protein